MIRPFASYSAYHFAGLVQMQVFRKKPAHQTNPINPPSRECNFRLHSHRWPWKHAEKIRETIPNSLRIFFPGLDKSRNGRYMNLWVRVQSFRSYSLLVFRINKFVHSGKEKVAIYDSLPASRTCFGLVSIISWPGIDLNTSSGISSISCNSFK